MATPLGSRAPRLAAVRALRTVKGRREQQRYAFEGATLLAEAYASGVAIEELYATEAAYGASPLVQRLAQGATPTFIVEESSAKSISDLVTPTGLVAIASIPKIAAGQLFTHAGLVLVLADVSDPANAGTLLRSAEAFGCADVAFGSLGIDPYHPKVVRGSMGAIFRVRTAVTDPESIGTAASSAGFTLVGLTADGVPLASERWDSSTAIVVGNERHGLDRWSHLCRRFVAIPMGGRAESLSAAVAGSIALYEASIRRSPS